ncbi:hypothetical protein [Methylobacterium nodulans]|uniref:Lipoprotein n=1 Tax=Methylobacterium nodulans (strain LMG 21967 / CNCM I-2342 / ORS 2060) TaxID=460265 RepID=B8IPP7_METNO|nr:hypothetical protein [Methylobacterium nodulans]ACL56547.1 conserved hypothetical protein [Methylobacterium nodulans ORS 2060]
MKRVLSVATALALLGTAAVAQTRTTNPHNEPPGQKMHESGSAKGTTGASGYTPGHEMQSTGSVKGTSGASGYAPGHDPASSKNSGTRR